MPTLFRFFTTCAILTTIVVVLMFTIDFYGKPDQREISVRVLLNPQIPKE